MTNKHVHWSAIQRQSRRTNSQSIFFSSFSTFEGLNRGDSIGRARLDMHLKFEQTQQSLSSNVLQTMQPVMKQHCCILGFVNAPWDRTLVSTLASWNILTEVPNKRTSFPPPHQSQSLFLRFWYWPNWANGWRVSSIEIQVESIHSGLVPGAKGGWEKTKWSDSIPSNVGNVDQVWDLSTWKVDKMQCKMVKSEA